MYKNLIKEFTENSRRISIIKKWLKKLPELEGIEHMQTHDYAEVIFAMPYDLEMFHRNREKLESIGLVWNKQMQPSPTSGVVVTAFHDPDITIWNDVAIHIHIEPTLPGSTCKRNLVGYAKTPIYEITCKDA